MKSYHSLPLYFLFALVLMATTAYGQIWSEDFNSYGNGTFNSPPKWTSYATDCDDGGINVVGESMWGVYSGAFTVNDIEGNPCCGGFGDGGGNDNAWQSEIIDLTGFCDISISMEVFAIGSFECNDPGFPIYGCSGNTPPDNSHDQVVAEYSLDGGAFTQFGYVCGSNGAGLLSIGGLNGSTLQLRFTAACKSNGETYTIDNIVVNGTTGGAPTFNPIGPLCESDPPVNLPTISLENITGTWDVGPTFNPAGLGNTTATITFTPDPSFCAIDATMDIVVDDEIIPSPPSIGPLCETDPPQPLPTVISSILGNWSGPGVTNNVFDPSLSGGNANLTFTPDPSECAQSVMLNIIVNAPVNPMLGTVMLCDNDPLYDLTQLEDPLYPGGTWTGQNVSGNMFDPTGLLGNIQLTYIPVTVCTNIAMTSITVEMAAVPMLGGPTTVCENAMPIPLTPLIDPAYALGTWSGPGVNGNFFNPGGLVGDNVLTFTSSEPCVAPATTIITVDLPIILNMGSATVCESEGVFDLTTIEDPADPGGIWFGPGVNGSTFDPTGLSGVIELIYDSPSDCANIPIVLIPVIMAETPVLLPATTCENGGPIDLTTLQDPVYPLGTWSGPGVNGTIFDPNGLLGNNILTFTSSEPCVAPAMTNIVVTSTGNPTLGSATICEADGLFDLTTLTDPLYPDGVWSGPGVTGNSFDPSGLTGVIVLDFLPADPCASAATTNIEVTPQITPNLGSAAICELSGLFDLTIIVDPLHPVGNWSGQGVSGNNFDPTGLSGSINITYTPSGDCVQPGNTFIVVNTPGIPNLDTAALCETAGLFNLNNIADPNFPAGTWSGEGVIGNNFDPDSLSGNIPLVFTPSANCAIPASTFITVNTPVQPNVSTDTLCKNNGLFNLNNLVDTLYPIGTWSGPGVTDSLFNPINQMGDVRIIFTSSASCTIPDTILLEVYGAPIFSNLDTDCDPATQMFTVSFDISGGSGHPYTVNGNPITGNKFTSNPLPSGPFSFMLNDSLGCGPTTIAGSANCACTTDAGNMDFTNTPIVLCRGSDIEVEHLGNEFLDADDNLIFVLHTNAGTTLGTVLATSTTTTITNPGGLVLGQTYYISAVAGNDDGNGGVDLTDDCLSVSQGIEVSFYIPTIVLDQLDTMCANDCFDFTGTVTGVAPFVIAYFIGSGSGAFIEDTLIAVGNNFSINFCPATLNLLQGFLTFEAEVINDANGCSMSGISELFLYVNNTSQSTLTPTLCPGESIVVNGSTYDANNPSGSEVFFNGSVNGCDSTVNISLSFYPSDTTFIEETFCSGGSLTVNGIVYDENNPDGIEVVDNGSVNGCDSIISVNLTFNDEVIENIEPTLCPGGSITVNGEIYDANNPSGTQTFPNGSVLGCDSTVVINLSFFQPAVANLAPQLCTGGSITINGEIFDENNPSGTQVLMNASINGCDSTININASFADEITFDLTPTLCPEESITVNGTVYDINNPAGSETFPNGSVLGCDSMVNISLGFFQTASLLIDDQFCTGGSITVNGTVYDENNPSGTEVIINGSAQGCDSTVVVDLNFSNSVTETINQTLCAGQSVTINGTVYDETMPSGTDTIPGGSVLGCDSIIIVDLTFIDAVFGSLDTTLCHGEILTINGTEFDEANPTGIVTIAGGSVQGCDSTINVTVGFFSENIFNLTETLCAGDSILVNGMVYNESNPAGTEFLPSADMNGCDSTIIIDLDFYQPNGSIVEPQLCTGGSVTVNGTVYNESNPVGVEVFQNADVNGCDSVVFVNLTFTNNIIFEIEETICLGDSITINGVVYDEDNPTGSETIVGGSVLGCDSTIMVTVSFFPLAVGQIAETLQPGDSLVVNGTVYNQTNPSGTEILVGGSVNGCDSIINVSLLFSNGNIAVDYSANSTSCELGNDGSIVINSIAGGQPPYTIALNGSNSDVVAVFPYIFDDLENGFYSLTVVDASGMILSVEIFLPFPTPPFFELGPDIYIDLGESITLSAVTDFTPSLYFWEPDTFLTCTDCEMPFLTPGNDITYFLTVTDENGCTFTDNVSVFVQKARNVYGPSAFSPNNDAKNDEFTLFAGQQVSKINSLLIFDRWGALMFEQYNFEPNNLSIGWDGRHKGQMMNPGVYVWFAEVEFLDGEVELYEGGVTLIR